MCRCITLCLIFFWGQFRKLLVSGVEFHVPHKNVSSVVFFPYSSLMLTVFFFFLIYSRGYVGKNMLSTRHQKSTVTFLNPFSTFPLSFFKLQCTVYCELCFLNSGAEYNESFLLKQQLSFTKLSIRRALRSACNVFHFSRTDMCVSH